MFAHTYYVLPMNSPHYDDDKVQHVPAVSDVGVLVHDQAVGNNLQKCFYCENDQEGIFYCFLYREREKIKEREKFSHLSVPILYQRNSLWAK